MDRDGFRKYLEGREFPPDQVASHFEAVEAFEDFLLQRDPRGWDKPPSAEDFSAYSKLLIQDGDNTFETYLALIRYAYFVKNEAVYLAGLEQIDGAEAMDNLEGKLVEIFGQELRDQVLTGIHPTPLGTPSLEKSRSMGQVIHNLVQLTGEEQCQELLKDSLRDLPDEWYAGVRGKFLAAADLDDFLARKGDEFIAELEDIKTNNRLYFTQKINDEVIAFVNEHPEIRQGVREGNILYEAKIPYMAIEYLAEQDEARKRYYYCHCPWARESIPESETTVPGIFCNCSAGYHKKYWELAFDQPLKAEVVESVLKGDPWCKFAIHLPEELIPQDQAS